MIPGAIDLAVKMRRLTQWVDSQRQPASLIRRQFRGGSMGHCYVTIDPGHQTSFASSNLNRVYMCGAEPGMSSASVPRMIDLFLTERVKRFFVWLSPGPDMEVARGWLDQHGLSRVQCTGYPTLCRTAHSPVFFRTDLDIREVSGDEIAGAGSNLGETAWPEYERSTGGEGFFHYMAFDGNLPVAVATLCIFEDVGYLMAAATAESHRKRGAQQALIAKRIERAEQAGCSMLVSETLYMLEHSYRNLQRAGFAEAYEKEVYEWNA
ncbi:GNAT family N-acetyltransferase [Bradyrhizobium sp. dw_78]|uniref:GNAT family N-acetyltransferase n=1 Tax=Bradyrhizobium sp. dw_78 TaxID=2719793 RepID=UPI001BD5CAFC|nr:GNAT family N-acetyltransferase [Bradyrhizobium sp. dw_78]